MRGPIVFFLLIFILLVGCVQEAPSGAKNQSDNQTVANQTLTANATASPAPTDSAIRVGSAALCRVNSSNQVELFLFDPTRYAYELQSDGRVVLEMVYANETLYVHYLSPPVAECPWMFLTRSDLDTVHELGGVRFMTHGDLISRISADYCQTVPLMESVFSAPSEACPLRDVMLRAQRSG